LPLQDELLHRSRDVLDRDLGIDTVLVEEVDRIEFQPLERGLRTLLDVLGATVETGLLERRGIESESELRGNHDSPTERSESFAHELFVCERTVDFGGI